MKPFGLMNLAGVLLVHVSSALAQDKAVTVSSLAELATASAGDGRQVTMTPGVYRMADYLTAGVLEEIAEGVDRSQSRPPVPMFVFKGKDNRFDLRNVVIEIDTSLCFYIQAGDDIRIEDCHAEGVMRSTTGMLADVSGPAADLGFKSDYDNRDGRYQIQPGYTKSLVEDGFRTYGGARNVTLVNCTAIHTRSGFEIGAKDDSPKKTIIENCLAKGCERGFLLGSNVIARRSRGDISHGPLLYLRGGLNSDIELELAGGLPESTVHAIATLAGSGHRVRLTCQPQDAVFPGLPLMLGFGMPAHAEMASPILPASASNITLVSELPGVPVLTSSVVKDCRIQAAGKTLSDEELRKSPGDWGSPAIK